MIAELENLTETIERKTDKRTWKTWLFSDFVENINEKVVPNDSGLEHYIGLEHLDSGSLHIRRFGETKSLIGNKLKIYKGDLIFAKRNAYLKRVSMADFDAVASAHSLVLRAKPDVVVSEFLPFFLLSETFWERAIEISVGSLSPTINWKTLAKQEFLLPPKEQQVELAKLLWSLDNSSELKLDLEKKVLALKNAYQRLYFEGDEKNKIQIEHVAKVYSGGTPSRKNPDYWGGDIPWIKTAEVNYTIVEMTEEHITDIGLAKSAAKLIPINSLLLAMYGQGVTRGRVALTGIQAACNQACAVIEVGEDYLPEFLFSYLEYKYEEIRSLAHGANQQNLNLGMIKSYKVPRMAKDTQSKVVVEFSAISASLNALVKTKETFVSFNKSIINKVF